MYVAQNAGLAIDFKNLGNAVAFRIVGLRAVNDNGEIEIMPLQSAAPPQGEVPLQEPEAQDATTPDVPLQAETVATPA